MFCIGSVFPPRHSRCYIYSVTKIMNSFCIQSLLMTKAKYLFSRSNQRSFGQGLNITEALFLFLTFNSKLNYMLCSVSVLCFLLVSQGVISILSLI